MFAAIDELVQQNCATPSAEVERQIIRLRHAAFDELRGRPEGELPDVGSVTPATGTIAIDDLTLHDPSASDLRSCFLRFGAALLPQRIDADRVAQLVDGIDRSFDAYDAIAADTPGPDSARWYSPFNPKGAVRLGQDRRFNRDGGGIWATDSPGSHFLLVDTLRSTGLTDLVADYFAEPPAVSVNKSTLRRVPPGARTGDWHQDGAFLGDGIKSVNAWICLSDCGVDAPGLDLVPTRMGLADTGTEGAHFDWAVAPQMVENVRGDVAVIRPTFRPGDILLFDHLFLHRTASEPTMTNSRYAIETWFFAPSCYPDSQFPVAL